MAQKAGVIFEHGDEVRRFLRGRNRVVEGWLNKNWERLDVGMTGPVTRETVSKVLSGRSVLEPTVKALHILRDEIRADPWAWCKPPERVEDVEGIRDYAEYSWWYEVLQPPVPWTAFASMSIRPLKLAYREVTQTRLSEWSSRLRAACDQFMTDQALVRALRADMNPEFQFWGLEDSGWRLGGTGQRHRVGNPGLHGRSPEEIGLAFALSKADLPLPLIEEARLAYTRPNASPVDDHVSSPVEPWNGLEFEGVEWTDWEDVVQKDRRTIYTRVEHRVVYHWDGARYQVADVDGGQFVRVMDGGKWRPTTARERELMITRIVRKHETADELLARRDQWVADRWVELKEDWAGEGLGGIMQRQAQPDGVPESEAVRAFEAAVERARLSHDVRNEQEDLALARSNFKLWLRRRP